MFDSSMIPSSSSQRHLDLFQIRGPDGKVLAQSGAWGGLGPNARMRGDYAQFRQGGVPYRAVMLRNVPVMDDENDVPKPNAKVTVVYATSQLEIQHRLAVLAISVGSTSLLLLLIANGFAGWSIRKGLAPLRELATCAESISVRNWDFRPPAEAKLTNELAPLVAAMETVLARLQQSFQQQRDFTSDAAHELKTSVAIVKSTLQSLLHRPRTSEEYREGLEGVLEDCARLEDLLARMLRLARIEQMSEKGLSATPATTELTSTCEAAISRIQPLATEREIAIGFDRPAAVYTHADPEDLELIWINLLENAVQYSPPRSKVTLRVKRNGGGMAEISVADSGPGIPPAEMPHIFQRFHRGDPSRARSTGGFGLGLAICKALTEMYGGRIEATNLPTCGAEVRVSLPAEPHHIDANS
jgi:signal transduction histidine kinase